MQRFLILVTVLLLSRPAFALQVKVEIEGLGGEQERNARIFLSIEQEKDRPGLSRSRLRLLHRKAPEEIRRALQPFGYFQPRIESDLRTEAETETWVARYRVEPGARARLREVDFRIDGEGAEDSLLQRVFDLAPDERLDLVHYEAVKKSLLSLALQRGYLDAAYRTHEVRVERKSGSASIRLYLDTGPRYRFGEIRFLQDILDADYLARYLSFGSGDPYSHEKLLDLQAKLIDSEYFRQVEVHPRRDQARQGHIPVDVDLQPNKKNRYRIGLGYSTDTGPRLTLDWKRRRIGREGHRMRSQLRLSKPQSTLSSEYIVPLERPTVDYLSFGATLENYDTETSKGDKALLNVSHSMGLERGWRRTLSLDYLYEDFVVGAQDDNARLLVPGVTWSRIKGGGVEYVKRGMRLEFHFEGAADALLSSTNYLQSYTTDKFIHSLNDDWRLLARLDLGATWVRDLPELPPSKRFYAGGDNSVRGFGYQDLGPRDENGDVIGGRYLAVGSLEAERRLWGNWSAALFFDAGNAYDPGYAAEIAYGAGLGLRWRSPVGPIRFDLASGHCRDEQTVRLHIVLGPEL